MSLGIIPPGIQVCHKCDVRHCCNPDHLFLGTREQNNLDRWKWHFVKNGKFLPGDYDQWREETLFRCSWEKSDRELIDELGQWEAEADKRPHVRVPISAEDYITAKTVREKVELIKRTYKFTSYGEGRDFALEQLLRLGLKTS